MKAIKIVESNAAQIKAALKAVNFTAHQHAYTEYWEIEGMANAVEKKLEAMGLPKAQRTGAKWVETSGAPVAKAYGKKGFSCVATRVVLERRSTGWFLVDAEKDTITEAGGGAGRLSITKEQDAEAVRRLRAQYQVAA